MTNNNFWADRRTRTGYETAGELAKKYNRQNYRLHPETQQAAVEGSLDELGFIDAVSVSDKVNKLFDGHLRVELGLLRFGEDFKLPVDYYDLDEEETAKALLYRDITVQMAEINLPALQELRFEMPEFENPAFDKFLTTEFDFVFNLDDVNGQNNQNNNSDGSLLALVDITIDEPQHKVKLGQVWRLEKHILICNEVLTGWQQWIKYLEGENVIFAPYPGPFVPLSLRAEDYKLVMVQPDPYIAGHILDKYAEVKGEDLISCD